MVLWALTKNNEKRTLLQGSMVADGGLQLLPVADVHHPWWRHCRHQDGRRRASRIVYVFESEAPQLGEWRRPFPALRDGRQGWPERWAAAVRHLEVGRNKDISDSCKCSARQHTIMNDKLQSAVTGQIIMFCLMITAIGLLRSRTHFHPV